MAAVGERRRALCSNNRDQSSPRETRRDCCSSPPWCPSVRSQHLKLGTSLLLLLVRPLCQHHSNQEGIGKRYKGTRLLGKLLTS